MRIYNLLLILAVVACAACTDGGRVKSDFVRLDTAVYHFQDLDSAAKVAEVDSLMPWLKPYFAVMRMSAPDVEAMDWLSQSEAVRRFEPDVLKVWPDLGNLQEQTASMLMFAQENGLKLCHLRFATVVWGYSQSIVRADSVVLVALNHYLGADYPGYSHWEAYSRRVKTPEMLPYNLAEALVATEFPYVDEHPTMLSRMLYEGALVEAIMRLVPEASEELALGYTPAEFDFARKNVRKLWEEMAAAKMVYDSDPVKIDRMTAPAPSSPLMGMQAPGRIGRFIGYEIVRKYLSTHKDVTLPYLLSAEFYADSQSLINSGF